MSSRNRSSIVAWILALILVIGLAPAALASVSDVVNAIDNYDPGDGSKPFTATDNGDGSVTVTGGPVSGADTQLAIPGAVNITIICEASLSGGVDGQPLVSIAGAGSLLIIDDGGSITNTLLSGTAVRTEGDVGVGPEGTVTSAGMGIEADKIEVAGGVVSAVGNALHANGYVEVWGGAQVTASGAGAAAVYTKYGKVDVNGRTTLVSGSGEGGYGIFNDPDGDFITIYDATVIADKGIGIAAGASVLVAGTVEIRANGPDDGAGKRGGYGVALRARGSVEMTGGTITSDATTYGVFEPSPSAIIQANGEIIISGGSVIAAGDEAIALSSYSGEYTLGNATIDASGEGGIALVAGGTGATVTGQATINGIVQVPLTVAPGGALVVPDGNTLILDADSGATLNNDNGGTIYMQTPGSIVAASAGANTPIAGDDLGILGGWPPPALPPANPADADSGAARTIERKPAPVIPVLYDIAKQGDSFTFTVVIANGSSNMAGKNVIVTLNERYITAVTIDADGVGYGTIEAPGFAGNTAHFSARVDGLSGAVTVATTVTVYSTGEVVRR